MSQEKDKLEQELKELSQEVGQELFQRMKQLQEEQLEVDFSDMSEREEKAKVAKNANRVEEDKDYRTLGGIAGKLDEARLLIGRGLGAYEPDEEFVEEPEKVEDEDVMRKLREGLEEVSNKKIVDLEEEEVERLEELLEEFSSKAD